MSNPGSEPKPGGGALASPWVVTRPVASLTGTDGIVTVVEGSTFCVSGRSGDVLAGRPHGLFVMDTRVLSRWQLTVDGEAPEPLTAFTDPPFEATFIGRVRPSDGRAEAEVVVHRRRSVGGGMREVVELDNFGSQPVQVRVQLWLDVDFADVFEVKESRVASRGLRQVSYEPTLCTFVSEHDSVTKRVEVRFSVPASVESGRMTWDLAVPPGSSVELCSEVTVTGGEVRVEPRFRCGQPDDEAMATEQFTAWRTSAPAVSTDDARLAQAVAQAIEDLGALRIYDPGHPDDPVIAAGAPWFMTLFGRDSLISAWMALIVDPTLAKGVLETLARLQGSVVDDATEEQPGRILHEVRFDDVPSLALGGGSIYYGTVDATPLFVMLTGELRRWGIADDVVAGLLPHVDRALAWMEEFGDHDGDGYIEYQRRSPGGLENQGWKDSWDGISFADGRLPEAPIALCEVQGYAYAALVARAHFALEAGDDRTYAQFADRAARLRESFNRDFWLPDQGWFAVGLDRDKAPIDALTSNVGHLLWTGIADIEKAGVVADRLLSDEMFSGWGIRTLATTMSRYNPVSYHNGSVWPHDNAICAAGLMRYGHVSHALRVIEGLLDAADALGGRLPELFAGFDRQHVPMPAAYPTSCAPQAWASASPLLLLRTMLRLDPWSREHKLHLAPVLLPGVERVSLHGLELSGCRIDIDTSTAGTTVRGAERITVVEAPRDPLHQHLPGV